MTNNEAHDFIGRLASQLAEHFSSVQIVATKLRPDGGTEWFARGSGDWYARKAACEEFAARDAAKTVAYTIKEVNETE